MNLTTGDFCIRCHNPVGMNLGEKPYMSSVDRHPASYEGITCVVCHRLNTAYGRVNGRVRIDQGPIFAPVKGPLGDTELKSVLANPDKWHVTTEPGKPGREIHGDAFEREQVAPINLSLDLLPFLRPETSPSILAGHPRGFRKFRRTLPPLAKRWASYNISEKQLDGSKPPYTAHVEFIVGMLAPALVYEVQGVGFDSDMSPREVGNALRNGYQVIWQRDVPISVPQ